MSLVLHYFKKDLRRSRWLLLFWLALVGLQYGLLIYGLTPGNHGALVATRIAFMMIMPLRWLLTAILVGVVVQEESPSGTTGFWLTRPVHRSTVLLTKLITLALIVLIPTFSELAELRLAGFVAHDLVLAAPEIILVELQVALWAAAVASLTMNFARFAIMALGLFIVGRLLAMGSDWFASFSSTAGNRSAIYGATIPTVRDLVTIAGLAAALVFQYLTRRSRQALVLIFATLVGSVLFGAIWRWDFLGTTDSKVPLPKIDSATVQTSLRETRVQDAPDYGMRDRAPRKALSGTFGVRGLPREQFVLPTGMAVQFTTRSGEKLAFQGGDSVGWLAEPNSAVIRGAFSHAYVYGRIGESEGFTTTLAGFDPNDFRRHSREPLQVDATMELEVSRLAVSGHVPLAPGASIRHGSARVCVVEVLHNGRGLDLVVETRQPRLRFGGHPNEEFYRRYLTHPELSIGEHLYVLANTKTGEVVCTRQLRGAIRVDGYQDDATRLQNQRWQLSFGPDEYAPSPDLDEGWLAAAELVELSIEPVGRVTQTFSANNFTLDGPNKPLVPNDRTLPNTEPEWLTRFTLPEHPTKAQLRKYVSDVAAALPYWHSSQNTDLPVDTLAKVGPGNADILLEVLRNQTQNWPAQNTIVLAVARAAGPQDKSTILGALPAYPQLAEVVVKFHWEADCRAELLRPIEQGKPLPRTWILAVASLHDPSTYPALERYLINAGARRQTYEIIRTLPGIDLTATIQEAWRKASAGSRGERTDAAQFAAEAGLVPALGVLVDELRNREVADPGHVRRVTNSVRRLTSVRGDAAEIVQWYDANKDRLVYDPAARKFITAQEKKS